MSRAVRLRGEMLTRPRDMRNKMLAKIHTEFARMRPDLRHSTEELREARLEFITHELGLKKPLTSMKRLSDKQLGRVIEAIKRERGLARAQPKLPGVNAHHFRPGPAHPEVRERPATPPGEVIHLIGPEQLWAINRIFDHLGWSQFGRERFLQARFNRSNPAMLTPAQGNSLMMILLNIAAHADLRKEGYAKVSRAMIHGYMPTLKNKLGIDLAKGRASDAGNPGEN